MNVGLYPRISNNRGFTLIELLVVISIISLLSAIVLGALSDYRVRSQNTRKIQEVEQLINALELYYGDYGHYPKYGDLRNPATRKMYCVGYGEGEECLGWYGENFGFVGNYLLNTELNNYISGPPKNDFSIIIGGRDYKGITYGCSDGPITCKNYELWWFLKDTNICPKGRHIGFGQCKFESSKM